jgi:hypothetical protein
VGLGVVTVVLIHDPHALMPRPPYWPWLMQVMAVALFGMILQLGLEDGRDDDDAGDQSGERALRWRAGVLAYLLGVLASVTYFVSVWLINRLDRAVG